MALVYPLVRTDRYSGGPDVQKFLYSRWWISIYIDRRELSDEPIYAFLSSYSASFDSIASAIEIASSVGTLSPSPLELFT